MTTKKIEMERFDEVIAVIRRSFPNLAMEVSHSDPNVDAIAEFSVQPGLPFAVSINLQNCDELHLNVSRFWVEWFPCGKQQVFDHFLEALTACTLWSFPDCGVVRVRKPRDVPLAGAQTKWNLENRGYTWFGPWVLVPWLCHQRIVRNSPSPSV